MRFHLRRAADESGSTTIAVLLACVIIPTLFIATMSLMQSLQTRQIESQTRKRFTDLAVSIQMIYSDPAVCAQNLPPNNGWPENVQALKTGPVSLLDPMGSGTPIIAAKTAFREMMVDEITNTGIVQLFPGEFEYLVEFQLKESIGASANARSVLVPFYVQADGAGVISKCFSSYYVNKLNRTTLEDELCMKQKGADFRFKPSTTSCATGSLLLAASSH